MHGWFMCLNISLDFKYNFGHKHFDNLETVCFQILERSTWQNMNTTNTDFISTHIILENRNASAEKQMYSSYLNMPIYFFCA